MPGLFELASVATGFLPTGKCVMQQGVPMVTGFTVHMPHGVYGSAARAARLGRIRAAAERLVYAAAPHVVACITERVHVFAAGRSGRPKRFP